jgi:hypothetical protein
MRVPPWRLYLLVCAAIFSGASACRKPPDGPSGYQARIGVAVKLNDRVCMAVHNAKLLPSATITLLQPTGVANLQRPSSARALVLDRNAESCPGTKDDTEVNNYNLSITTGTVQPNVPLIALDARVPSVYAAHSFHACASADGIHLTAWDGAKPLEGHRLWKQYYYLSQDLKQNCTAAETAP